MIRAVFGGSFDPIHAGHVAIIDLLRARGLADVVHVVPAGRSPLKRAAPQAAGDDRLFLAHAALDGRADVVVEDLEITRPPPSYTVDTLDALVARYPHDRWRLVIGADQAAAFESWRDPQGLLALAEPVVIARGPVALPPSLAGRALVIEDFDHPASATAIRSALAAGARPGRDLLPATVAAAIQARGLYRQTRGHGGGRQEAR